VEDKIYDKFICVAISGIAAAVGSVNTAQIKNSSTKRGLCMNLNWFGTALSLLPLLLMVYVMYSAPASVEEENIKRITQGKEVLTLEEFQRRGRKARKIACIALVLSWAVMQIIVSI